MKVQELGKCKKHPRYKYTRKPRPTNLYPEGCPTCWELWHRAEKLRDLDVKKTKKKRSVDNLVPYQVKKGQVLNPEGKSGPKSIHEYARKKLKNGKELVDRLDKISNGKKAGSSVKDELSASQLLYKIMKDDEIGDKPQDVRVIVLNVKDATFEEYQRDSHSS